jgi:aryl-alcohol dehydrogenase-like predicted oxidoreductase
MQNYHNAIYREVGEIAPQSHSADITQEEREMMPTIESFGVGCIPWSPLAAGSKSSERHCTDKRPQPTARKETRDCSWRERRSQA